MKIKNYKPHKKQFECETDDRREHEFRAIARKNARAAKNALKWVAMYEENDSKRRK